MVHKSSVSLHWRLQKSKYRLIGTKCITCNSVYYPPKNLCPECRRKGKIQDFQFAGTGKIISYTIIRVPPEGFEKNVPYAVAIIQLDEGTNISGQVVGNINNVKIGKKVKAVFRKMYEDGNAGIIHYGLKWEIVD
jgi:hypothetical protein